MENPANPTNPASTAPPLPFETTAPLSPREVEREFRDLRYLVHLVMGVLVALLVTTTLVLFHQIRSLAGQAGVFSSTSVELTKAVQEYETNTAPQLNRMFEEFQQFARTDAEFAKIMARYRLSSDAPGTNDVPTATPPAQTPQAKP